MLRCSYYLGSRLVPPYPLQYVYSTLRAVYSGGLAHHQLPSNSRWTSSVALKHTQTKGLNEPSSYLDARVRKPSNTSIRRTRESPSEALIEALRLSGNDFAIPQRHAHKVDLSYVNPRVHNKSAFNRGSFDQKIRLRRSNRGHPPRLQAILTEYIRINRLHGSEPSSKITRLESAQILLSRRHQDFLANKGYTLEDVEDWYSILTTRNTDSAARLFLNHVPTICPPSVQPKKPLPVFVLLFFLRRQTISASALRTLIIVAWQEMHRMTCHNKLLQSRGLASEYPLQNGNQFPVFDSRSIFLLIIRLLRYARIAWPEALISIAAIFTTYIGLPDRSKQSKTSLRKNEVIVARITAWYNKTLSLLAIPSSLSPFHSVAFYQRSQFDVLQRMAEHNPPLAINREGYRAIVSVQLRNKKTEQEREWAQLKVRSWPPWKEEKIGLDAEKGPEYGVSRALQAIHRAREAGYGDFAWEKTASILAGWDIDGSPTIQTRALLFHKLVSPSEIGSHPGILEHLTSSDSVPFQSAEWAARIRATRTIQEAWACFLAYGDRHQAVKEDVYFAMLSKMVSTPRSFPPSYEPGSELQPPNSLQYVERQFVAGDSPAPLPIPESPKEMTYVRFQPPTFDELVHEMFQNNIIPKAANLAFLLANTKRLSHGLKYIGWASKITASLESLLTEFPEMDERLHEVPDAVFAAYIKLLVRSSRQRKKMSTPNDHHSTISHDHVIHDESPLIFATRLLQSKQPLYRPPWHTVLYALTPTNSLFDEQNPDKYTASQCIENFFLMRRIFNEMKAAGLAPTIETFAIMSHALEMVIVANLEAYSDEYQDRGGESEVRELGTVSSHEGGSTSRSGWERISLRLKEFQDDVDVLFEEVFGHEAPSYKEVSALLAGENTHTKIPTLLAVPYPWALHAYMRVLGLQCDWARMLKLLKWMATHQNELAAAIDMPRNGSKLLRRTIVAARVFMERSWVAQCEDGVGEPDERTLIAGAPPHIIKRAKKLIEEVPAWRGWPLYEEVENYCRKGRFPRTPKA